MLRICYASVGLQMKAAFRKYHEVANHFSFAISLEGSEVPESVLDAIGNSSKVCLFATSTLNVCGRIAGEA